MNDTIYRRDAIQALVDTKEIKGFAYRMLEDRLIGLPSAHSLQGEWIDKGDYAECSNCGAHNGTQYDGVEPVPLKTRYCPNCGARMKGADDEYERAVEQMEHDMLYEPTYNPEDGSM